MAWPTNGSNELTLQMWCVQDTEEALMANLRDSHILNHKQNLEWNWLLIATILKVSFISVPNVAPDGKKKPSALSGVMYRIIRLHIVPSKYAQLNSR